MNNAINEIKNTLEGSNGRITEAEDRINEVEDQFSSVIQSCPTLCDPIDGSPTGSPVAGFLQARTLEWVAISFSNA